MTGKQKCKILKEIRRQIAAANEIRYVVEECTHKGKCKGTCPRCEWEVRELEKALEKRRLSGKKIALAGISAGLIASTATACSPVDTIREMFFIGDLGGKPLAGDPLPGPEEYLEGEVEAVETNAPANGETENVLKGQIVAETLLGDVAIEVDGLIAPPETDEETDIPEIVGLLLPADPETEKTDEEEYVLEGDVVYPDTEEEA